MQPQSPAAKQEILIRWARDLSTCTEQEIRARWQERDEQRAIDMLDPEGGFEKRLNGHNPIYFLAENLFFDNVRGDQSYLYRPFHLERFCKPMLAYFFSPVGGDSGFLNLAQRDSFKSVFGHGVLPIFVTLRMWHLEKKNARVALLHQKIKQASINLVRLKQKALSHPWFRTVWSPFTADEDFGTQEEFIWPCAAEELREIGAMSVVAAGLTSDLTGYHFDHMFFSDLVVKEHSKSKIMREATEMYYNGLIYTRDIRHGKLWHDGTRYHINDLWGKMLKGRIRACVTGAGISPETLTFPTRHSWTVLESLRQEERDRTGTDLMWWLQMQNDPRSAANIAADVKWFREINMSEIPSDSFRCIFVDPAWKGTKNQGEGDDASIQAWAFWRQGSLVMQALLDLTGSNEMTDADGRSEVGRQMKKFATPYVAPEERGGKSFSTNLANDAVSWGIPFSLVELKTQQMGKPNRIASFLGALQARRVAIVKGCRNAKLLLDQVEDYPQVEHDDHIDCAGYTADPAIAENYTPLFNAWAIDRPWARRRDPDDAEAPRTRYCGV